MKECDRWDSISYFIHFCIKKVHSELQNICMSSSHVFFPDEYRTHPLSTLQNVSEMPHKEHWIWGTKVSSGYPISIPLQWLIKGAHTGIWGPWPFYIFNVNFVYSKCLVFYTFSTCTCSQNYRYFLLWIFYKMHECFTN